MQRVEHQILRWTSLNVNIFHRFLWSWWKWWDDIWSPIIYENYSGLEQPGSTAPFAAKSFFCIRTILNNHTVCIIHLTFKECTQFVLNGRAILKYFGSGSGVWQVFADLVHRICPQEKAAQEDFICVKMKAVQSFVSHTPGVWHLSRPLIWHKPEPVFLPVSNPVILQTCSHPNLQLKLVPLAWYWHQGYLAIMVLFFNFLQQGQSIAGIVSVKAKLAENRRLAMRKDVICNGWGKSKGLGWAWKLLAQDDALLPDNVVVVMLKHLLPKVWVANTRGGQPGHQHYPGWHCGILGNALLHFVHALQLLQNCACLCLRDESIEGLELRSQN